MARKNTRDLQTRKYLFWCGHPLRRYVRRGSVAFLIFQGFNWGKGRELLSLNIRHCIVVPHYIDLNNEKKSPEQRILATSSLCAWPKQEFKKTGPAAPYYDWLICGQLDVTAMKLVKVRLRDRQRGLRILQNGKYYYQKRRRSQNTPRQEIISIASFLTRLFLIPLRHV